MSVSGTTMKQLAISNIRRHRKHVDYIIPTCRFAVEKILRKNDFKAEYGGVVELDLPKALDIFNSFILFENIYQSSLLRNYKK